MSARIAVVSLRAENVAQCAHFYRDVLGLPLVSSHGGHVPHFQVGEGVLVILQGVPQPALDPVPERFPVFALAVEDLDAMVEKLRAHGVALPWGIEGGTDMRYVMFSDPGGNLIELVEGK